MTVAQVELRTPRRPVARGTGDRPASPTSTPIWRLLPREQAIELLDKLVVPSLEKLAKEGRIRAGGLLVGARAGVFVVAAKSHDEVTEFVRALPAWGVWNWKVTPLESFAHRADLEKKVVQELRAQKK